MLTGNSYHTWDTQSHCQQRSKHTPATTAQVLIFNAKWSLSFQNQTKMYLQIPSSPSYGQTICVIREAYGITFVVREFDVFELSIWHYSRGSKVRSWFSNESLS